MKKKPKSKSITWAEKETQIIEQANDLIDKLERKHGVNIGFNIDYIKKK